MNCEDHLLSLSEEISCDSCGRCCPADCPHLKENLCSIHPSQSKYSPEYAACELGPTELVLFFSIFCPLVLKKIEKDTRIAVPISTDDQRYCDQDKLKEALVFPLKI